MGGKMDWRRAAQRTARGRPEDQRHPTVPQPAAGPWSAILAAMEGTSRTGKGKRRKAALK
jgi:hypothetical protein